MYTEDEFESLIRNSVTSDKFQISTSVVDNRLHITLKTVPSHRKYRRYSTAVSIDDLEPTLRKQFESLENLQLFLRNQSNISVDLQTGTISLILSMLLYNGKAITTKLGEIKLKQDIFDADKCLQAIIQSCQSGNSFNQSHYHNTIKQFAIMFKVLFKKFQVLEYPVAHQVLQQSDFGAKKQQFFSFKPSPNRNVRYGSHSIEGQQLWGDKNVPWRKSSVTKWASLSELQKNMRSKSKSKEISTNNKQLEVWKNLFNQKMQKIIAKHQQSNLDYDIRLEQIRKQLKAQIASLRKEKQDQNRMWASNIPLNRSTQHFQNYLMSNKLLSSSLKSESPKKIQQNNDQILQLRDKLKKLRVDYDEFSEAVMSKIQDLGSSNQKVQNMVKKVILELDFKMEEKIMQDAVQDIKSHVIDTQAPYFEQFQLKGTQILYKGQDSLSTMLLSKIRISQRSSFSIKIVKTLVANIQIGLVDATERVNRDCWSHQNFILYVGWNSTIYEGPSNMLIKQGQPLTQGDIVTLKANTETGLVQWIVGGQTRAKVHWEKLKDKEINWVPFVRFYDNGDIISWVTEKMLRFMR